MDEFDKVSTESCDASSRLMMSVSKPTLVVVDFFLGSLVDNMKTVVMLGAR